MEPIIALTDLRKTYRITVRDRARSWAANFFHPRTEDVHAVDGISLQVMPGETVAFIGPNGAGKSTTIKMCTGILWPTSGAVRVCGLSPQDDRRKLAYRIGTVFGQRSQLIFNLPVRDSLVLAGVLYDLSKGETTQRIAELSTQLDLGEILDRPVRKLSLGQRMRAEVASSLLHRPDALFLDEPTIGLDLVAKRRLRAMLQRMNEIEGTTIFLTSHDVGDIEALCKRTVLINHGKIVLDVSTSRLRHRILTHKRIRAQLADPSTAFDAPEGARIVRRVGDVVELEVDTATASLNTVLATLLARAELVDLDVQSPPLEDIIETLYLRPTQ